MGRTVFNTDSIKQHQRIVTGDAVIEFWPMALIAIDRAPFTHIVYSIKVVSGKLTVRNTISLSGENHSWVALGA